MKKKQVRGVRDPLWPLDVHDAGQCGVRHFRALAG
jgi:hypothetical protein